jgi:hypothetical protein
MLSVTLPISTSSRIFRFSYGPETGQKIVERWYTDASVRVEPGVSSNSPIAFQIFLRCRSKQDSASGRSDSSSAIQYQETQKKWNKEL